MEETHFWYREWYGQRLVNVVRAEIRLLRAGEKKKKNIYIILP